MGARIAADIKDKAKTLYISGMPASRVSEKTGEKSKLLKHGLLLEAGQS